MIERFIADFVQLIRDRVAIVWLRREIDRLKLDAYDLMAANVRGLRRALETQKRAIGDLRQQLAEREGEIARLREEYAALESRQNLAGTASLRDERLALFRRLQSVATQLPTLRAAVQDGADLEAQDILDVLRPVDQALRDLGFERIGEAGSELAYDPRLHKAVGRGAKSLAETDVVRVRYVGYRFEGEIVCKAEVVVIEPTEVAVPT